MHIYANIVIAKISKEGELCEEKAKQLLLKEAFVFQFHLCNKGFQSRILSPSFEWSERDGRGGGAGINRGRKTIGQQNK